VVVTALPDQWWNYKVLDENKTRFEEKIHNSDFAGKIRKIREAEESA
jgi:hypothetical protein